MITETDLTHLRRCVELATEALDAGDEPFGSVLVSADGKVPPVRRLTINEVVPALAVDGPAPELADQVHALHRRLHAGP